MFIKTFILNLIISVIYTRAKCVIDITTDIGFPQPILLNRQNKFYLPSTDGLITLEDGDYIGVGCPGSTLTINLVPFNDDFAKFLCKGGKYLLEGGSITNFESISCQKSVQATAKIPQDDNKCTKSSPINHIKILIGFQFTSELFKKFITLITTCFDTIEEKTIYSSFNLTKSNLMRQLNVNRPLKWGKDYFTIQNLDDLYTRNTQRKIINTLIGLDENDLQYINNVTYINRGHLTAMADFIYATQQKSTFFYVNSAPQWSTFNGGNWKNLEEEIRDFSANNKDLIIHTGTYETLTLPYTIELKPINIYLSSTINGFEKKIPVPKTFWKIIHDPDTETSLAFIGINNPHLTTIEESDIFCNDICDKVNFARFDRKNITNGYIFCCELEDFRNTVKDLPDLGVTGLLSNGCECCSLIKTGFIVLIASFVTVTF
ncbi:uncharacterized protein [Onthophagus taurus]|uniref:uncharacterized protein n=1 Tax=Onthophagus taurus TaxID=166361 RepID=UPI000C20B9C9|nr:uncharacterized protein LOC111418664 [Onthophagus taurus]